ncbi:MAG TPA: septal ring lytic transglycosylase RlpA family protein [Rubrobacteraceae bacterium]|nr:septal ring lytic transglycosylase RlpA family protein [Rubrobacteraceae bacterium]
MKSFLKMLFVAGVFAGVSVVSLAVVQEDAQAEPVEASYYGYELAGSLTASGQPFDPTALTAAHKTLPLGTQLLVTYGGNSVVVTVNDRGPYVAGRDLDLSQAAAEQIGLTAAGSGVVDMQVIE